MTGTDETSEERFFFYLHIPGHLHMVTVKDSPGLQS